MYFSSFHISIISSIMFSFPSHDSHHPCKTPKAGPQIVWTHQNIYTSRAHIFTRRTSIVKNSLSSGIGLPPIHIHPTVLSLFVSFTLALSRSPKQPKTTYPYCQPYVKTAGISGIFPYSQFYLNGSVGRNREPKIQVLCNIPNCQ